MRRMLPVVAALVILAAAAACSGGDDEANGSAATTAPEAATGPAATTAQAATTEPDDPRPEPAVTQSRWAAGVDDACEPWQGRIDELPPPTDAVSLTTWLGRALPMMREQIAAVKAVRPPAGAERRKADLFLGSLERLERALTRYRAALAAGNGAAAEQALVDANVAGSDARRNALEAGVTQCGGYAG